MRAVRLFLCGDVMTGRGIDQVLQHPCDPALHESYVHSAIDYVRLAEARNGPIPRPVGPSYIWGAALHEWHRAQPDARIVNLETSITRCEDYDDKGINYRMSPEDTECLSAAKIDCCVLANNHVLDWGRGGLLDTVAELRRLKIRTAGAGHNIDEATAPAVLPIAGKGRVLVFSYALASSGVPRSWSAKAGGAGVSFLGDLSEATAGGVSDHIARARQPDDMIVVSLHWGPNWGYDVLPEQRHFAHALIDHGEVSIVHGHSSHHAKAIEVYRDRLILYGCGDFINDYEGIEGYEDYRSDLALMYFADISPPDGKLAALDIVPLQIRQFRLNRASAQDVDFMRQQLGRESRHFGAEFILAAPGRLKLTRQGLFGGAAEP